MTGPQDVTAEGIGRVIAPGRGYEVGQRVSLIFHPVTLGILNFFIVGLGGVAPWWRGLAWAVVGIAIHIVPPTIFFTIRLRQGAYSDEDVSVRQQHNELYIFSLGVGLFGIIALLLLRAPLPFLALVCGGTMLNIACGLINLVWKISMHSVAIAASAAVATIYMTLLAILLWVSVVIVGWARVRTGNHTLTQVFAGLGLATVMVFGVFYGFGLL